MNDIEVMTVVLIALSAVMANNLVGRRRFTIYRDLLNHGNARLGNLEIQCYKFNWKIEDPAKLLRYADVARIGLIFYCLPFLLNSTKDVGWAVSEIVVLSSIIIAYEVFVVIVFVGWVRINDGAAKALQAALPSFNSALITMLITRIVVTGLPNILGGLNA